MALHERSESYNNLRPLFSIGHLLSDGCSAITKVGARPAKPLIPFCSAGNIHASGNLRTSSQIEVKDVNNGCCRCSRIRANVSMQSVSSLLERGTQT